VRPMKTHGRSYSTSLFTSCSGQELHRETVILWQLRESLQLDGVNLLC